MLACVGRMKAPLTATNISERLETLNTVTKTQYNEKRTPVTSASVAAVVMQMCLISFFFCFLSCVAGFCGDSVAVFHPNVAQIVTKFSGNLQK